MKLKKLILNFINQEYLFSIFSKLVGVALAVVYSVIYNRYLGAALKGEAAIISNYISLISSFTCLGMYQAYPFYKKKGEKDIFYSFVNNMTSLYLLMLICCIVLIIVVPIDVNLKFAIALVPIHSYIRHINYVVTVEAPKRRNISSILINLTDILVVLGFFIFTEASYKYLVIILIVQLLINLAFSYSNLHVVLKKLRFDLSQVFKYAKYGIVPMITLMLMTLNYRVDILMLENAENISKTEIGVYSVGVALAERVWLVPDAIKDILLSRLSRGKDNSEVSKVIRISLFISLVMLVGFVVFGKLLINILYGPEYADAYKILIIMLAGVIGMVFYKMVYSYNVVQGKKMVNMIFLAIAAIINVIGNFLLIPTYGIAAAAWTSVISYTICGLAFLFYFCILERTPVFKVIFLQKEDLKIIKSFFSKIKNKHGER